MYQLTYKTETGAVKTAPPMYSYIEALAAYDEIDRTPGQEPLSIIFLIKKEN